MEYILKNLWCEKELYVLSVFEGVCVYYLSLVSLRLRGTRSRNKRAYLLRFESADLSYLS